MRKEPETLTEKFLTRDIVPISESSPVIPPPTLHIDKRFKSWGGVPEKVDNWQAIALTAIETISKALMMSKGVRG